MSNEFLKQMDKAGEKYSGSGGQGIVGRILIEFGFHRWVSGHEFWNFWKPVAKLEEMDTIADEVNARLLKAGNTEGPSFGIKVTVKKDVLSRDEPYKADLLEFTPKWQDGYQLLLGSMETANLPVGEVFYGRVQYKANPHFVKMGESGKKETDQNGNPRYPSLRVPTEKFANEQVARDAVGDSGSSATNSTSGQYSDMVYENYDSESAFELNFEHIKAYYKMMTEENVKPFDAAPDFSGPWIEPKIKQYLAKMYVCETPDIDLVLSSDIPPF